ncbi:MAG: FtsX-like permease family protein [Streptosporangiales bacterium]|nr:FtsX-like permease family protein [Streptosporangiales bacterium]
MNLFEVMRSALHGLLANKLRSVLTMLGVLIGVASVILLVAVGTGSARQVQESIDQLGTNTLTVMSSGGGSGVSDTGFTPELVEALGDKDYTPDVRSVTPQVMSDQTLVNADVSYDAQVIGTVPSYFEATNSPVANGQAFTSAQQEDRSHVVVLGATVAQELYGIADPVGRQVTIAGMPFLVVGVLEDKGSAGFSDTSDSVVAPLSAVQDAMTGYGPVDQLVVQATSAETVGLAEAEITAVLDQQLDVTDPSDPPYRILNQQQIQETGQQATTTFTVLLAAIAAISLLVGGIGITNIMLVTVTERTREIGIRKALGAPRGAVLGQFLAEATLLSLLGGVLGIVLGVAGSRFTIMGVQPEIVPASVIAALGVSLAIGVFFGGYPANRAAALPPIRALRYE